MASSEDRSVSYRYASRQLNTLCEACQTCFPIEGPWCCDELSTIEYWDKLDLREFSIRDLHEAAEAGCHLCRVFLDSFLPYDMIVGKRQGYEIWYDSNKDTRLICSIQIHRNKVYPVEFEIKLSQRFGDGHYPSLDWKSNLHVQSVRLLDIDKDDGRTTWVANLGDSYGLSPPGTPFTIVQPQSTTSFSESSFAQVRKWLTECLNCHEECSNYNSTYSDTYGYQRKVRFVDVGNEECPMFRLVDGKSLVSGYGDIKYVTLSYRWTTETEKTKMQTHNKADYENSIPTDTLPQVYKDAATVARFLGVRYVWIDSLCIIQDSLQDWNEQSSMMDLVYIHGVLNLSAMFGDRVSGLQAERDPLTISPCILSRRLPKYSENGEEFHERWVCYEKYGINSFVHLAPLFKRAWCHQERLLPVRNLYFGEQLIWQCQITMVNESFPSYIPRGLPEDDSLASEISKRQHSSIMRFPLTPPITAVADSDEKQDAQDVRCEELSARWEFLASLYSKAEITKQTDRLVAIRGVLNRWAEFSKEHEPDWCIAGLWKRCLVKQLLWNRDGDIDKRDSRLIARAKEAFELFPSWSWASCVAGITYTKLEYLIRAPSARSKDMIKIESIQADQPLSPEATYTAFETSSRIVLRGLVDAEFNSVDVAREWTTDGHEVTLFLSMSYGGKRTSISPVDLMFDRPMPESLKHQDLKLLPIRLFVASVGDGEFWQPLGGLLLESLGVRNGLPTYRRMGVFKLCIGIETISAWLGHPEEFTGEPEELLAELREKGKEWPLLQLV